MAKSHYSFKKRQKDLKKKMKQEEKRLHRLAKKEDASAANAETDVTPETADDSDIENGPSASEKAAG